MIRSRAFGLKLRSNLPIPGLPAMPAAPAQADLDIILGEAPSWRAGTPHYEHAMLADGGEPLLRVRHGGPHRWQFSYADGTTFYLDRERAAIWATWSEPLTVEDTATYLLGPVLGFFLRLTGQVCLHASAVMLGEGAVAFVGAAGSGKSTLAAAFAARGHPVLSEDVTCLHPADPAFFVQPGYPRIRLWDDSARLLSRATLPLLTPNWDKRYVPLDGAGAGFRASAAPLRAVGVLEERQPMAEPARLRLLRGQEALKLLIAHSYGNLMLDRAMRAREFAVLGRLAQRVPVFALCLNAEGARLDDACVWIEAHAPE